MRILKLFLPLALIVGMATGASADGSLPGRVFECQVETTTGAHGLITIQTRSPERAREGVIGYSAATMAGSEGTADRVIQCIEKRTGERFADSSFQAWVDSLEF